MKSVVGLLHGREGNPEGSKGRWLSERYTLLAPWYQTEVLADSVAQTRAWFEPWLNGPVQDRPQVMIGSSYGGAVLHEFVRLGIWTGPTVYLAPAFMLQRELGHSVNDYVASSTHPTVIIHGTPDDIVPVEHSLAFLRTHPQTLLIAGPWSHRLGEILVDGTLPYAIAQALAPVSEVKQAENA
ncbi:MAG: hypothetical protein KGO50_03650 [Myxococcales bacterium]|nr:hypothetical protein [Myxococcales bacterium]